MDDQPIEIPVLKIDETRRNIVVSRRALIEEQRSEKKKLLLSTLAPIEAINKLYEWKKRFLIDEDEE